MPDLTVDINGVKFNNLVFVASGSYGHGKELFKVSPPQNFGAVTIKSLLPRPNPGNPAPRLHPMTDGMLNAIGLPGMGVDNWFSEYYNFIEKKYTANSASLVFAIWGKAVEDFIEATKDFVENVKPRKNALKIIKAFEINVSCPNTSDPSKLFSYDPDAVSQIVESCRKILNQLDEKILIFTKLSPNQTSVIPSAVAAVNAGSDALIISNTMPGKVTKNNKSVLGNEFGGLSGPQIKPIVLKHVDAVIKHFKSEKQEVNVIACGGILNANDVLDYMRLGCKAVEIATGIFLKPRIVDNIISDLNKMCLKHKVGNISELIEKEI